MGTVDEQIGLIVALLLGASWEPAPEPTPIYDDMVRARNAGFTGEYHVHWELEMAWAQPDPDFPF